MQPHCQPCFGAGLTAGLASDSLGTPILGQVTTFIVDNTYGEDAGVKVDIRPLHPLRWGPTYPIFINASSGENFSHKEFVLTEDGAAIPRD